jgi:rhodanese-related sulfurtransferase
MTNDAAAFFAARLAFQTDVSDVQAALSTGDPGFVLVDARSTHAWEQGHIPGAVHVPHADIAKTDFDPDVPVVTYCWGPGCNGATRAALALARKGIGVREMVGGVEYWVREGFGLRTPDGLVHREVDPLTAPACGC